MKQKQIDITGVQTLQHLVDPVHCPAFPVFAGPQLGCHPDLLPRDAAFPDSRANAALRDGLSSVFVNFCSISKKQIAVMKQNLFSMTVRKNAETI